MFLILNRKPSLISNYRIITAEGANVYLAWINELSGFWGGNDGSTMLLTCSRSVSQV